MEEYSSIFGLPLLQTLFESRRRALNAAIGQLHPEDFKTATAASTTAARLQSQFQLQPVVLGEPEIMRDEEIVVDLAPGQSIFGLKSKAYLVDVEYPFTGSPELLGHAPTNVSFGGNTRVYKPGYGRSIPITVQVSRLERAVALAAAEEKMQATRSLIAANAAQANAWSAEVEREIADGLARRKNDLDALYGKTF